MLDIACFIEYIYLHSLTFVYPVRFRIAFLRDNAKMPVWMRLLANILIVPSTIDQVLLYDI
jgi:hypothetical protein